jgi:hypothetical protein
LLRLDSRAATQSREELGSTFNRTRQHSDLPQIIYSEHCRRNPALVNDLTRLEGTGDQWHSTSSKH